MGNQCCNQCYSTGSTLITFNRLYRQQVKDFYPVGRKLAKVIEVYDGDTITLAIEINSEIYSFSTRLYGIDTPELKPVGLNKKTEHLETPEIKKLKEEREKAIEARDRLSNLLNESGNIVFADFNDKREKFGRLLATIYQVNYGCTITAKTESINNIMLREGHAKAYFGGKKGEEIKDV